MMKIIKRTICKIKICVYNIKMKKIILLLILIAIVGTHVYENRKDRLLSKFVYYALQHEDVVFETDIENAEYACTFGSLYSINHIKPELQAIKAQYNPFIWTGYYKHRCGSEGISAIIAVRKDHSLFMTYLDGENVEYTNRITYDYKRCNKVDYLHYKIKNKKLYITRKSPD